MGAAVDAVALHVADDVVLLLAQVFPAWIIPVGFRLESFLEGPSPGVGFPPPLHVKVSLIRHRFCRGIRLVVDVEIVVESLVALVLHFNNSLAPEGHGPPSVETLAVLRAHLKRRGDEILAHTVPQAEEIADGTLHARFRAAVPVHAQHDAAAVVLLGETERHPDMLDAARTVDRADDAFLAGFDAPEIGIFTGGIPTGNPAAFVGTQRGQRRQAGLTDHGSFLSMIYSF